MNWNNNGLGVGTKAAVDDLETLTITFMDDDWAIPDTPLDDTGNVIAVEDFEKTTKATVTFDGLDIGESYTYRLLSHVDSNDDGFADSVVEVFSSGVITATAIDQPLLVDTGNLLFDTIEVTASDGSTFLVNGFTLTQIQTSDPIDLSIDFTGTITDADGDSAALGFTVKFDGTGSPLEGSDEGDLIQGNGGDDMLIGGVGDDILIGGAGNDTLYGDNEDLTGVGVDTFRWEADDEGSVGTPAVDTIKDFNTNAIDDLVDPGDIIDLADLLDGEDFDAGGNPAGNLEEFLYFELDGGNTVLHVSTTGGFTPGAVDTGLADQQIVFEGVDLVTASAGDQEAIIADLLTSGKLITD